MSNAIAGTSGTIDAHAVGYWGQGVSYPIALVKALWR